MERRERKNRRQTCTDAEIIYAWAAATICIVQEWEGGCRSGKDWKMARKGVEKRERREEKEKGIHKTQGEGGETT